jgi:hypothetical protein
MWVNAIDMTVPFQTHAQSRGQVQNQSPPRLPAHSSIQDIVHSIAFATQYINIKLSGPQISGYDKRV